MKKSKFLFTLLLALITNFSVFANTDNNNPIEVRNDLTKEISNFMSDVDLTYMEESIARVNVQFLITPKNEIIVLDVDNEDFEYIIKGRLNYKTVKTVTESENKIFVVPVVFQKK